MPLSERRSHVGDVRRQPRPVVLAPLRQHAQIVRTAGPSVHHHGDVGGRLAIEKLNLVDAGDVPLPRVAHLPEQSDVQLLPMAKRKVLRCRRGAARKSRRVHVLEHRCRRHRRGWIGDDAIRGTGAAIPAVPLKRSPRAIAQRV